MDSLSTALTGVEHGQAKLEQLDRPIKAFAGTLGAVADGRPAWLSWQSLVNGAPQGTRAASSRCSRRSISTRCRRVRRPTDAIRADARALALDAAHGVRVRLTGPIPLQDEEYATLADRAGLMGAVMLLAVMLTLWLAVQSFRIIFAILVTLFTGLALTMGAGLFAVGVFNIISIAFVALFVGLGVDFGIQFCVRYRAERHGAGDLEPALMRAGRGVGTPLALAAAATAAGFFSFLPTAYVGVGELGLIAGIGMVVAFVLSITMLPALLMLLAPRGEHVEIGFAALAPADLFIARNRRRILIAGALAGPCGAAACIPFLRFDFNPLDLRSRKVESVSTLFDLMRDPETSPNTIDVLAPSLGAADKMAQRLSTVPEVGQVLTLKSFVPDDQQAKLALISDASLLLDAALNPFSVKPPPSDAETVASIRATAKALRECARHARRDEGRARSGKHPRPPRARAAADARACGAGRDPRSPRPCWTSCAARFRQPRVARDDAARFRARLGRAGRHGAHPGVPERHQGHRRGDEAFQRRGAAHRARGDRRADLDPPVGHHDHGGFRPGGASGLRRDHDPALILVLRRVRDVLLTIAPLLLSGLLTLATCVAIGLRPQLRQRHRAAAAVRHRRRVRHLFRDGLARGRSGPSAIEPDARGHLQRADHGVRLRHAVAVEPSRHRKHGRASDDLAGLDAGDDAVLPARAAGAPADAGGEIEILRLSPFDKLRVRV